MNAILAALASIPRIASSLEALATAFTELNARAVKARAGKRRESKDAEVDARLAALLDDTRLSAGKAQQRTTSDESGGIRCSCNCSSCVGEGSPSND